MTALPRSGHHDDKGNQFKLQGAVQRLRAKEQQRVEELEFGRELGFHAAINFLSFRDVHRISTMEIAGISDEFVYSACRLVVDPDFDLSDDEFNGYYFSETSEPPSAARVRGYVEAVVEFYDVVKDQI